MRGRGSGQRANVLVHAVSRVILGLDLLEPPVVGPVRSGDRFTRLVIVKVVDVAAGSEEGLHLLDPEHGPDSPWLLA